MAEMFCPASWAISRVVALAKLFSPNTCTPARIKAARASGPRPNSLGATGSADGAVAIMRGL
jgi:hypothetical protein